MAVDYVELLQGKPLDAVMLRRVESECPMVPNLHPMEKFCLGIALELEEKGGYYVSGDTPGLEAMTQLTRWGVMVRTHDTGSIRLPPGFRFHPNTVTLPLFLLADVEPEPGKTRAETVIARCKAAGIAVEGIEGIEGEAG